jgi:DNA-binding beta-propeller fold protein YncE
MFKDGVGGVDGLDGAYGVAVSSDGKQVFVTGEKDDALVVFDRTAATGVLVYREMFKDGVGGVDGLNGPYDVAVSSDGKQVFVAGFFA